MRAAICLVSLGLAAAEVAAQPGAEPEPPAADAAPEPRRDAGPDPEPGAEPEPEPEPPAAPGTAEPEPRPEPGPPAAPGTVEPAPPGAANPYAEGGPESEPAGAVDPGTVADPVAGRAWFFPTALTPPAGSLSISWTEIILLTGSWSPANTIQISANSFLPALLDSSLLAGTVSGKVQLVRTPRLRISGYGLGLFAGSGDGDADVFAGLIGGVASYCLDRGCHSLLSGFAAAAVARGSDSDLPVMLSASWIQRLHRNVKLAFEVVGVYVGGEIDDIGSTAVTTGGARFVSSWVALELGAAGVITDDDGVQPLPWFSLTFRGGL